MVNDCHTMKLEMNIALFNIMLKLLTGSRGVMRFPYYSRDHSFQYKPQSPPLLEQSQHLILQLLYGDSPGLLNSVAQDQDSYCY